MIRVIRDAASQIVISYGALALPLDWICSNLELLCSKVDLSPAPSLDLLLLFSLPLLYLGYDYAFDCYQKASNLIFEMSFITRRESHNLDT